MEVNNKLTEIDVQIFNEDSLNLFKVFGIDKERRDEIVTFVEQTYLQHNSKVDIILEISSFAKNHEELALIAFTSGIIMEKAEQDRAFAKHLKTKHENFLKDIGQSQDEAAEEDVELNFDEEEKEEDEELTFD